MSQWIIYLTWCLLGEWPPIIDALIKCIKNVSITKEKVKKQIKKIHSLLEIKTCIDLYKKKNMY